MWYCEDCGEYFDEPDYSDGSENEFCPHCRSMNVEFVDVEEEEQ